MPYSLPDRTRDWPYRLRSPGRINIIGEHVDYNGGLVMPAAIDKAIYFAARPIEANEWRLHALDLDESFTLDLPIDGRTGTLWVDYLAGIGVQYQDRGHLLPGMEILFGGDLPSGSGMSSSAALEGGMAFLLNEVLGIGLNRPELAQLCKTSSNTFLGIPSGIMDQFASLNGRAGGPIVLNCRTLSSEPVVGKLEGYDYLLVNSMVSHDLSDGAYAQRVEECQAAFRVLKEQFGHLPSLSDASPGNLRQVRERLDDTVHRRARYVIDENRRVRRAINAVEAGAPTELGSLLNETHVGLRDEYEVSCAEIDFLQQTATELEGVAGARLMGGGFGGCTLNLVEADRTQEAIDRLSAAYEEAYAITPECYPVRLAAGTDHLTH